MLGKGSGVAAASLRRLMHEGDGGGGSADGLGAGGGGGSLGLVETSMLGSYYRLVSWTKRWMLRG